MIRTVAQIVLNGLGVLVVAWMVPGIDYEGGLLYLLLTGLVVGAINVLVKPLVTLLSLPFIIVTLGIFFIVINAAMLVLASALLDGLSVNGCAPALLGGLVLGLFNWAVRALSSQE